MFGNTRFVIIVCQEVFEIVFGFYLAEYYATFFITGAVDWTPRPRASTRTQYFFFFFKTMTELKNYIILYLSF